MKIRKFERIKERRSQRQRLQRKALAAGSASTTRKRTGEVEGELRTESGNTKRRV
jgi:hypothetical protein